MPPLDAVEPCYATPFRFAPAEVGQRANYVSGAGLVHLHRLHLAYADRTDQAIKRAERQIAALWSGMGALMAVLLILVLRLI